MRAHHSPPHGFDKFLARARERHGERFQYDRSSWISADQVVRIQCAAHGWFEQISRNHLRPKNYGGCRQCRNLDGWERFLADARKKHGSRFEYNRTSWNSRGGYVDIRCITHGWFKQKVFDHLRHSGCFQCAQKKMDRTLPVGEVIEKFKRAHGDRYSYEKVVYAGNARPVIIVCGIHGDFRQKPAEHVAGNGCQKCSKRHRWTTEEFIQNAIAAHAGKYAYAKSVYSRALDPVIVTCPEHGDFTTQPSRHVLFKHGCPEGNPVRLRTTKLFVEDAVSRFGKKYDYSLVNYVNAITPVKIICPEHGVFEQPPTYHLNNAIGCQKCTYSVSNKESAWLDGLGLPPTTQRQARIKLAGRLRNVDAFDPASGTVYEFWGDWWHGHPEFFAPDDVHPKAKHTYGQLYDATQRKRAAIKRAGYRLIEIWEHEYDELAAAGQAPLPVGRLSRKRRRAAT